YRGWPNRRAANDGARRDPSVIDKHEVIREKPGVKHHIEQARIIPALALITDVQHQCLCIGGWMICEGIDAAFALPNDDARGSRQSREAEGIGEKQVGERYDRRPVAGNNRSGFGHLPVEEWADVWMSFHAVGLHRKRELRIG